MVSFAGELLLGAQATSQWHCHKLANDPFFHTVAIKPRLLGDVQEILRRVCKGGAPGGARDGVYFARAYQDCKRVITKGVER
jgi:hypothetical protein